MHRANVYKLLARIYLKEPTKELLELLEEIDIQPKESLEELVLEYTHLFIGPGKHIAPYESVQRADDSGVYWGEATVAVKNFIEAAGLKFEDSFAGTPDHISAEFEFMQKLIENETKISRQIQRRFFEEHIEKWVPRFCQRVKEESNIQFYKDMADLTRDFIFQEKEEFENV